MVETFRLCKDKRKTVATKHFSDLVAVRFAINGQTTDLESMELLTPRPLIIVWQIFCLSTVVLFVIALILILTSKRMNAGTKVVWLLGTMCLPVLGPILLLVALRSRRADQG
jgi:hypothetical protein